MKKIITLFILVATISLAISACAPTRGRGCPTTNKNFFKP